MRRTRTKGILTGALILIIGVVIALVVKNYVAAQDDEEPVYSVNLAVVQPRYDYIVAVLNSTEGVKRIQGTITYDSEKIEFDQAGNPGDSPECGINDPSEGLVSFIVDRSEDGRNVIFYMKKKEGVFGTTDVSLSIDSVIIYESEGRERQLSGDQVGGSRSATVDLGSEPVYEDPRISPAEWTLNSAMKTASLRCIQRGYEVISWSSSDESLVTVEANGEQAYVTTNAERAGDAVITVTLTDGKSATALIHVTVDEEPDIPDIPDDPDVPVDPDDFPDIPVIAGAPVVTPSGNQSLVIGDILQMSVDQTDVTWTSSDPSVVVVDSSTGLMSAVGKGAAYVTVKNNTGKSTSFYVIVNEKSDSGNSSSEESSSKTSNGIKNTTTNSGKETPTADDPVPQTGESTAEYIVIVAIVTLIVATIIFKIKSRKSI